MTPTKLVLRSGWNMVDLMTYMLANFDKLAVEEVSGEIYVCTGLQEDSDGSLWETVE